jgi:hypothetical protein
VKSSSDPVTLVRFVRLVVAWLFRLGARCRPVASRSTGPLARPSNRPRRLDRSPAATYTGAMRRLLLALCLLPVLALSSASASAEPSPPRDEIVPEGIEGLTAEEIYDLALAAARAGDVVRQETLLFEASRKGHENAALWLAKIGFTQQWPNWADIAMRVLQPIADEAVLESHVYFWLGFAGSHRATAVTDEQRDLWYRIAAHDIVEGGFATRAYVQRRLDYFGEKWLDGGELPWRFREFVGDAWQLRDASGDSVYEHARRACQSTLSQASVLCGKYLELAAQKGFAPAEFDYASRLLSDERVASDPERLQRALDVLCSSASSGYVPALERLSEHALSDSDVRHYRPQLVDWILRMHDPGKNLKTRKALLAALLTERETWWVEWAQHRGTPLGCTTP